MHAVTVSQYNIVEYNVHCAKRYANILDFTDKYTISY